MKISPARTAAFDILLKIERQRAFSSVLLAENQEALGDRDRALCHTIVLGVLRRQLWLDAAVGLLTGGQKTDVEVLIALRMGIFQLQFLDKVPAHTAVDESVSLVQRAKKSSARGFVNALLRRATREHVEPHATDELGHVSLATSHPRWLLARWAEQFGADRAARIAFANNEQPLISFRHTARGAGVNLPDDAIPSEIVEGAFNAERMTPELRELAKRGEIYFQDEASQMVADAIRLGNGERFLDVCAAPGGKTTRVAMSARKPAILAAGDLHEKRVRFLRENCLQQGVGNVNIVRYNAEASLPFAESSFDTLLIDAPCSGTGTIRSNPEIRYFLEASDLESLQIKQLAILANASKLLRPNGRLVYSTCSLEIEENEEVIAKFLSSAPGFERETPSIPDRFVTDDGFGRTFADRDGTDGFFIAALRKR